MELQIPHQAPTLFLPGSKIRFSSRPDFKHASEIQRKAGKDNAHPAGAITLEMIAADTGSEA